MTDEHFYSHITECHCVNPSHGGKRWMCDTEECELNGEKESIDADSKGSVGTVESSRDA